MVKVAMTSNLTALFARSSRPLLFVIKGYTILRPATSGIYPRNDVSYREQVVAFSYILGPLGQTMLNKVNMYDETSQFRFDISCCSHRSIKSFPDKEGLSTLIYSKLIVVALETELEVFRYFSL